MLHVDFISARDVNIIESRLNLPQSQRPYRADSFLSISTLSFGSHYDVERESTLSLLSLLLSPSS